MDRLASLRAQKRAYIYGVVEQVNGEWIFLMKMTMRMD